MDADHFDGLVRSLFAALSRRTVTRAFVGLVAGSVLAPLERFQGTDAAGKKGRRRRKKRKNKTPKAQKCGRNAAWCEAGPLSECCSTVIDPGEDDFNEICTHDCGCCDRGFSYCCAGRGEVICCQNSDRCAHGPDFQPFCCPPDSATCGGVLPCCPAAHYCCPSGKSCCPNGWVCCPNSLQCAQPPEIPCL